ncbi:MAG TPA: DNA-processing protein DprA [Dehalococcoidia bacterium]|nr:DNA-processing protein DprA [Dehalococcoidia bacterium]
MDDVERSYWIAFSRVPRIGRVRVAQLEERFGRLEHAWNAAPGELKAAGLDSATLASLAQARESVEPGRELERLAAHGVQALTWHDPAYPRQLQEVFDRPPVLYVRGTLTAADDWSVAIVGTRRVSVYGRQAAEDMARGLAANRVTVVSGLARGVDAVAHRATLDAGGRTVAVLACGLDLVYPPEHKRLAEQIIECGALISDYALGTQPRSEFFPRRNRILSGISLGVLVVEGDLKSGALITARQALEQNREVFAIPGSIYSPNSRGTNKLIQDGEAKLTLDVQDVLAELNLSMAAHQIEMTELIPADETESALLRHLSAQPVHIDEVRRESGLPIATVTSTLAMLELKGLVRQVGRMNYVRTREPSVPPA